MRTYLKIYTFIAVVCALILQCYTVSAEPEAEIMTADEFIALFTAAHEEKDIGQMLALVNWENVTNEFREIYRKRFIENFGKTITHIAIDAIDAETIPSFTQDNVTYVLNLKPVGNLKITFKYESHIVSLPVGMKDGVYYITVMVPEFSQYAQTVEAILNVVSYGYRSAVAINGIERIALDNASESSVLTGSVQKGSNTVKVTVEKFYESGELYHKLAISILLEDEKGGYTKEIYRFSPSDVSAGTYKDMFAVTD